MSGNPNYPKARIAVVIPCYKVTKHILAVLAAVPPLVHCIYVVDDACPDASGDFVAAGSRDPRVIVIKNSENQGVGGAVMAGYARALHENAAVVVKIDGDGQMDPALIPNFIEPILAGDVDYTKGNRFFHPSDVALMPKTRLFGNAALSLMNKVSSGYWDLFDPTNGYTAIGRAALSVLPFDKISKRYFFETDMLFRLGLSRAVVGDIPMKAHYADERSGLQVRSILFEFAWKHCRNFFKRVFYSYFLRDFSIASIELVCGVALGVFALTYGGFNWWHALSTGTTAAIGTVVLSAVAFLSSLQLLLSFLNFDIVAVPRRALSRYESSAIRRVENA